MSTEENGNRKKRTITCGWCDGITEMIRDCFPDDAGYSACLAMMNGNRGKIFGPKNGKAAKEENRGCCGYTSENKNRCIEFLNNFNQRY